MVRHALPDRPCRTLLEGILSIATWDTRAWFCRVIFVYFSFIIAPLVSIAITKPITTWTKTSIFITALWTAATKWGCSRFVCDSTRWNSNIPKLSTPKEKKIIICWEHNSSLVYLIILGLKYWHVWPTCHGLQQLYFWFHESFLYHSKGSQCFLPSSLHWAPHPSR